jgi:hypothetical protein
LEPITETAPKPTPPDHQDPQSHPVIRFLAQLFSAFMLGLGSYQGAVTMTGRTIVSEQDLANLKQAAIALNTCQESKNRACPAPTKDPASVICPPIRDCPKPAPSQADFSGQVKTLQDTAALLRNISEKAIPQVTGHLNNALKAYSMNNREGVLGSTNDAALTADSINGDLADARASLFGVISALKTK